MSPSPPNDTGMLQSRPLCVDLDGTLVRTDLFAETILRGLFAAPAATLRAMVMALIGRRAEAKQLLARLASPPVENLPFRTEVLALIHQARAEGRSVVLATAADRSVADKVAAHLQVFNLVMASNGSDNLKCDLKAQALIERFGRGYYDYIGDSRADVPVWQAGAACFVVSPSPSLWARLKRHGLDPAAVGHREPVWRAALEACRVHQWTKNLLVFVPIVANHSFTNPQHLQYSAIMFLAFGLTASAGYLCNDLVDLDADRAHPRKRRRPFAAGALPIVFGLAGIPLLLLLAFVITVPLPQSCQWLLAAYFAISVAYSFVIKALPIIDIAALAGLYLMRIEAGGLATGVIPSMWLTTFSAMVFLNLGCLKRVAELRLYRQQGIFPSNRRPYRRQHLNILQGACVLTGLAAVAVLAFYPGSANALSLYSKPIWLFMIPVVFGGWLLQIWAAMLRRPKIDDPVILAATDPASYAALILIVASAVLAR